MKYRNNNERFGESGPFEAASKIELADEMIPTFRNWAEQKIMAANDADAPTASDLIAEMREAFIAGLEDVTAQSAGGSAKTRAKSVASRRNGKNGGRPKSAV